MAVISHMLYILYTSGEGTLICSSSPVGWSMAVISYMLSILYTCGEGTYTDMLLLVGMWL
jgi:hypothetical protein